MSVTSLPTRFPVGTRYVIEGRRGKSGRLRIVSRQLILPNGRQFEVKASGSAPSLKRDRRAGGKG
jgi:hypothetical protein